MAAHTPAFEVFTSVQDAYNAPLVILGGGLEQDGSINVRSSARAHVGAVALYTGRADFVIVAGGAKFGDGPAEADPMSEYVQDSYLRLMHVNGQLGTEVNAALVREEVGRRIVRERTSADTIENIRNAVDGLRAGGYPAGKVGFVTDAIHMPRVMRIASRELPVAYSPFGIEAMYVPTYKDIATEVAANALDMAVALTGAARNARAKRSSPAF